MNRVVKNWRFESKPLRNHMKLNREHAIMGTYQMLDARERSETTPGMLKKKSKHRS